MSFTARLSVLELGLLRFLRLEFGPPRLQNTPVYPRQGYRREDVEPARVNGIFDDQLLQFLEPSDGRNIFYRLEISQYVITRNRSSRLCR